MKQALLEQLQLGVEPLAPLVFVPPHLRRVQPRWRWQKAGVLWARPEEAVLWWSLVGTVPRRVGVVAAEVLAHQRSDRRERTLE